MRLDPSGIYLCLLSDYVPALDSLVKDNNQKKSIVSYRDYKETISNYTQNVENQNKFIKKNAVNKQLWKERTVLNFYEVGTGKLSKSINNIFVIDNFGFSKNGKYCIMTSENGSVSIWENAIDMKTNIINVLNEMNKDPLFWDNIRISYENL